MLGSFSYNYIVLRDRGVGKPKNAKTASSQGKKTAQRIDFYTYNHEDGEGGLIQKDIGSEVFLIADGAVLIYDVMSRETFESKAKLMKEVREACYTEIPIMLVGIKPVSDLERKVSYEEGRVFAEKNNLTFVEIYEDFFDDRYSHKEKILEKMGELIYEQRKFKPICYDCQLLGDPSVGKSSLKGPAVSEVFQLGSWRYCGMGSCIEEFKVNNKKIRIRILDPRRTGEINDGNFGFWLVYDITNRDSFTNIARHLQTAREKGHAGMPLVLIGNKSDLIDKRVVSYGEGEELAKENGMEFIETSNVTGENARKAFFKMAELIDKKVSVVKTDTMKGFKEEEKNNAAN